MVSLSAAIANCVVPWHDSARIAHHGQQASRAKERTGGDPVEAALSAAEAALENQRIGRLQLRVAALCTLIQIQICDAFDVNAIAVTVPPLTRAWNLSGPAFTQAFVWSS